MKLLVFVSISIKKLRICLVVELLHYYLGYAIIQLPEMCFALYQFLQQRYTRHFDPTLDGKVATSNQVSDFHDRFKTVQLKEKDNFDMISIQKILSKEMRKEMLSMKETLRNEMKLEFSNEQLKNNLL